MDALLPECDLRFSFVHHCPRTKFNVSIDYYMSKTEGISNLIGWNAYHDIESVPESPHTLKPKLGSYLYLYTRKSRSQY